MAGPEYLEHYADCDEDTAHYYGCVSAMDDQIGVLLDYLDNKNLSDDTVIMFCSDNGPEGRVDLTQNRRNRGSTGGLRGRKRSLYNGGILVPALIRWPGVTTPGSTSAIAMSTRLFTHYLCSL